MKQTRELLRVMQQALALDPVLSVSTLAVFLYVASHEDCAAADICKDLKLAQPAVTRHLQRLSLGSPQSVAVGTGLELVQFSEDPRDSRRRLYRLSQRGQEVLSSMSSIDTSSSSTTSSL